LSAGKKVFAPIFMQTFCRKVQSKLIF
jgi:hypothetical protein